MQNDTGGGQAPIFSLITSFVYLGKRGSCTGKVVFGCGLATSRELQNPFAEFVNRNSTFTFKLFFVASNIISSV